MSSLYEKLGGKEAVNAAVEIFYKKIMDDDSISHLFADVDMKKQIGKQKLFLSYAFGGLPNYAGKSMRDAHKNLDLTEQHFTAVAGHLKATLEELNVPTELQDEVMTIVGSTHDDVLNI